MASSGIMRFAKKKVQCLGCRQPLDDATATLCSHCKPKARLRDLPRPPRLPVAQCQGEGR